jgi:hypothetical protein
MSNPIDTSAVKRKLEEELAATGVGATLANAVNTLPPATMSTLIQDLANPHPTKKAKLEDDESSGDEDLDPPPPTEEVLNAADLGLDELCDAVLGWTDTTDVIRMSVIQGMVSSGATGTAKELARRARDESATVSEGQTVLEYLQSLLGQQLTEFSSDTPAFPESGMTGVLDVDQDETHCVVDAAIGTSGMEPCIAVGLTVEHAGHRYNAMHHFSGVIEIGDVMADLEDAVVERRNDSYPDPAAIDFDQARYFAAGGTITAVQSQRDVAGALSGRNATVHFTNGPNDATRGKSALISATGEFSWRFDD